MTPVKQVHVSVEPRKGLVLVQVGGPTAPIVTLTPELAETVAKALVAAAERAAAVKA